MAVPQVPHPEHEAQPPVPPGQHRAAAEHQRLGALLGLRQLDEHAADEESVHHGAQQRLEEEQDDALGALVGDEPVAVADGGVGLDEEQKGGREVVHVGDTRRVGRVVAARPEVAADEGDDPPHGGHDQPGHRVGQDEDEQVPAPL